MKTLDIKHKNKLLLNIHVDVTHKDVVLNGFGITKIQAKKLRDWLTIALNEIR